MLTFPLYVKYLLCILYLKQVDIFQSKCIMLKETQIWKIFNIIIWWDWQQLQVWKQLQRPYISHYSCICIYVYQIYYGLYICVCMCVRWTGYAKWGLIKILNTCMYVWSWMVYYPCYRASPQSGTKQARCTRSIPLTKKLLSQFI